MPDGRAAAPYPPQPRLPCAAAAAPHPRHTVVPPPPKHRRHQLHSRHLLYPTVVGISPWHKVPRQPLAFWERWVLGEMDYSGWADLEEMQREAVATYSHFVSTLLLTYQTRQMLVDVVAAQPTLGDKADADDGHSLAWLRMLRACVRFRTADDAMCACAGNGDASASGSRIVFGDRFQKKLRDLKKGGDVATLVRAEIAALADSEFGPGKWGLDEHLCHLDVSRNEERLVRTSEGAGPLGWAVLPRLRTFETRVAEFKPALRTRLGRRDVGTLACTLMEPPLVVARPPTTGEDDLGDDAVNLLRGRMGTDVSIPHRHHGRYRPVKAGKVLARQAGLSARDPVCLILGHYLVVVLVALHS